MSDSLFDERRLVSRVLRHWQEMALGRDLPSRDNIDPWLIGDDWSYCTLVSLNGDDDAPSFLMVGSNLSPVHQPTLDFRAIAECPDGTILAAMLLHRSRCIAERGPLSVAGGALHFGAPVLFRAVLLPLSSDGSQIDGIFGAANFRMTGANEDPGGISVESVAR